MKYEVLGYQTSSDFDGRNFTLIGEYLKRKKAIRLAKECNDEYHITKVQSIDREEIMLFSNGKKI